MRQIILDTETTGLDAAQDHRIIEIGCLELISRRPSGRNFHQYLNPERDIDEGAVEVHGLTRARLEPEPKFAQIAVQLIEFLRGAELIIHNAAFDVSFLDAEFARLPGEPMTVTSMCTVVDSLALARQMHPGQRNSLDALCKRYSVDNSHRDYHGALLDARILAEVYLAMTGGQGSLTLSAEDDAVRIRVLKPAPLRAPADRSIVVIRANEEEIAAHEHILALLDKASSGKTVWRRL
jgi:DNA polymerase III subunit epsilon